MADRCNGTDLAQFIIATGVDVKTPELRLLKFDNRKIEVIIIKNEPEINQELTFQIYIYDRDNRDEKNLIV